MENAGANYTWQPETLMYKDTLTGHEVWRLSCTNNQDNIYHDDIAWPQWSADGAWLAFASSRDTKAFAKTGASTSLWMLVHTDGSHLMPIVNGSNRSYDSGHPYFHWSPQVPNVYYDTGGNAHGLSLQPYDVYQNQVSDTGVSRTLLFTTNQGGGNTKAKILSKTISGDGLKILLRDQYVASGPYYLYPCTVYPPSSARCDNPPGYTMDRGQGNYYGDMPTSFNKEHGGSLFLTGNSVNGYFVYLIPDGTGVHWRMAMTGSAADGGPLYTAPGTSGEVLIMSTGGGPGNVAPWPNNWFWSHPSPDWWATHVVFNNAGDDNAPGVSYLNVLTHAFDAANYLNDWGFEHNDWHGFTDYSVSSYTPYKTPNDGLGERITSQRYNDTTLQDITVVCLTYTRYNGGTNYSTLPRPATSPDGTKVMWSSEFLNSVPDHNDVVWAVVRYPLPPLNLRASASSGGFQLTWDRPSYSTRGWPNEQSDSPPKSKEIKGYHVWTSPDGSSNWSELTGAAVTMESFTVTQSRGTTGYYAVTSEEYSRLESRSLSEIRRVSIDASGNVSDTQFAPSGKVNFWTTPPAAPRENTATVHAGGPYQLSWTEPGDSKIRYYNIYYSTSGTPSAIQANRIASVPVGTSKYLDWLADHSMPGYYRITSVDRQGNEGQSAGPQPPQNLQIR
jgi:hypothetical protein